MVAARFVLVHLLEEVRSLATVCIVPPGLCFLPPLRHVSDALATRGNPCNRGLLLSHTNPVLDELKAAVRVATFVSKAARTCLERSRLVYVAGFATRVSV